MTALEARIAEVLGAHGYRIEHDAAWPNVASIVCVCGNRYGLGATHLAHQAAMLTPVIADVWDEGAFDASMSLDHGGHNADNPYRSAP